MLRVAPDIDEALLPDIAARKRKLHARIELAIRRNVAGGMPCAARQRFHVVFVDRSRRRAEGVPWSIGRTRASVR